MAGLDGVLNKIEPGEPLDKDIYDLTPEEMKSVPSMPGRWRRRSIVWRTITSFCLRVMCLLRS